MEHKYRIVKAENEKELIKEVSKYKARGWDKYGEPALSNGVLVQVMVKNVNDNIKSK